MTEPAAGSVGSCGWLVLRGPLSLCAGVRWRSGGILGGRRSLAQGDQQGDGEGTSQKDDPQGTEEVLTHKHPGHRRPIEQGDDAPHVPAGGAPPADPRLEHHGGKGDEKYRPGIHGGTLLSVAEDHSRFSLCVKIQLVSKNMMAVGMSSRTMPIQKSA